MAILKFPDRPRAEAEAARAAEYRDRLAADAHAILCELAAEHARAGHQSASWFYSMTAQAVLLERDRIREWTAARVAPEPEPDVTPGKAAVPGKARYGKRPCAVDGCGSRVRLDMGTGDTCGNHAPETLRKREAGEVRRACERLHAAVTRMA